jgi:ATP phosphoribosyltransferase
LLQATLNLLDGADIKFRRESRLDIALVKNLPVALVFLPAADIPTFVSEGRALGITGRDTVVEHAAGVEAEWLERAELGMSAPIEHPNAFGCEEVMDLSFGACTLQIQVPLKGQYQKPSDLLGKNIATSFVHLAEIILRTWRGNTIHLMRFQKMRTGRYEQRLSS